MSAIVLHRGAMGDGVLLWPLLRRLMIEHGGDVLLVSSSSAGSLAKRAIGVRHADIESRAWSSLWCGGAENPRASENDSNVRHVVTFFRGDNDAVVDELRRWFPLAVVQCVDAPLDRVTSQRLGGDHCVPPLRSTPGGACVLHVGAGSDSKRWPIDRFIALAGSLVRVVLIAGEVERERWNSMDAQVFAGADGWYAETGEQLVDLLSNAACVVANDSGPAHLSAQLGVPTVVLFGPTDPVRWAPIGPRVCVVSPRECSPMTWLDVPTVVDAVRSLHVC